MFKLFIRLIWRFKNRKLLKELLRSVQAQKFFEINPRTDFDFNDYLRSYFNANKSE